MQQPDNTPMDQAPVPPAKKSLKAFAQKVGKQALAQKKMKLKPIEQVQDRYGPEVDFDPDDGGFLDFFGFGDDDDSDGMQRVTNKKLPKKKAPPVNTKGAYYLANKERMDTARKQSDKNRLALRKSKMAEKTQLGRELRRKHKTVSSCNLYDAQDNCVADNRCTWSDKTKPKCKSKRKNVFKVSVKGAPKKSSTKKSGKKACTANQVRNPNTNRCVKRTSKKGKQILKGSLPPKKSSRYVAKYAHLPVGSIIRLKNGRCMEKRPDGRMVFTRLNKADCANSQ